MFSENIYDGLLFDTSLDSNSLDPGFCDIWTPNNPDGFPEMNDHSYQVNAWRDKSVAAWNSNDLLHWICTEVTNHNRDYEDLKLQNFNNIDGESFRAMSTDDFIRLCESSEDGRLLYESKENLCKNRQFNYLTKQNEMTGHKDLSPPTCPEGRQSSLSRSSNESGRKGRGRPRSLHTVRRKPVKRLGKLWEFLRNLLLDTKTCPSLIKWDNHNEGTFKFVQSEKVAQLWGDRKENSSMNYEKLSRAMRYYYRSKVLLPVAGKRLVYKFGPEAKGWRTENPILESRSEVTV